MKKDIHPAYEDVKVICSCGNSFETRSTACKDIKVETCSACHDFYTGKKRSLENVGRVSRFRERYGSQSKKPAADADKKAAE